MATSQPVGNENNLIITHGFHQELPIPLVSAPIISTPRDNTQQSQIPYIEILHQIEVMGQGKVLVPGCEPTSALSSAKLSSWLAESGCGSALVDLNDALNAIPGSFVKFGSNYGRAGMRQRWLVLPPIGLDCPCQPYDDYYAILRELANEEVEEVENFDSCDTIGMGYCPSPDFDQILPPPADPYKEEGSFPGDAGVLPPIPPWGRSGT